MKRTVLEVGLAVMVLVLGLEVVHYRNAVIECNIDDKRAWQTVLQLRRSVEEQQAKPAAQEHPDESLHR
jgi:hypothetical protein